MIDLQGAEEVIVFFNRKKTKVVAEMSLGEFQSLLRRESGIDRFAASVVPCAYATVGTGLAVHSVVLFLITFDEDGLADPDFNVPLQYLAEYAGPGGDIGAGRVIRLASRARCPVPWHALNLWEADAECPEPAEMVQKCIWRNRLGLKPSTPAGLSEPVPLGTVEVLNEQQSAHEAYLDSFGEEGRLSIQRLLEKHNEQIVALAEKARADLEQQQQGYLQQIKECKDQIQKLKVALRHERDRTRRLQQLLRGEV